jgi:uncharacterized membrane protein YphA (DoxX/SURF4 family)
MALMRKHIFVEIISSLLILLFVYTAISKLLDYRSFKLVMQRSPLIAGISIFLTWFLPVIELLAATLLLIPSWRPWGMSFSLLLMTTFTLYIAYMILFATHLPCSCGGVLSQLSWPQHLLFNITFMLIALTGYILTRNNKRFIAINRTSRIPV